MSHPLPIKSLLVFDAVMQHGSFTLAADALHVTPGAVGQQVQKLEDWLRTPLFTRGVRQIQPTAEARNYWATVQPALARIRQASDQLRLGQAQEVWLSMPPTLAAKWFAPRMAGFLTRQPGVSLHLSATTALIDFERDRVDLAIRHFDGQAPALQADLLYPDEARLYAAPGYLARLNLATPADLARATLLHTTLQPHWAEWLGLFSPLTAQEISSIPGVHFDQSMLAIETARHGQGVVLSSPILVESELREGTLCEPWDLSLPVRKGYYVVHPHQAGLRPAVQAFKDWLLDVAASERAHPRTHP